MTEISPRNNNISRSPCRPTSSTAKRCSMRYISGNFIPRIIHIIYKLPEKTRHIVRIKQTFSYNLSIPRISQPFTMRVTTYNPFKVSMHSTVISLTNTIKEFIGTFKTPRILHICKYRFHNQTRL